MLRPLQACNGVQTMTSFDILRLALLYSHLLLLVFALQRVLSEDWRLLMGQVDATRLKDTLLVIPFLLAGLWVTGLAIAAIDTRLSWVEFAAKPKLQTKLLCLCVLTANGWALHHKVFKRLMNPRRIDAKTALSFGGLGAISTSSWLFAAFVGLARPLGATPVSRSSWVCTQPRWAWRCSGASWCRSS